MGIIKKLDGFVLRNYLLLFAGTFCISLFVVMMQFLWKYVDDLVGKGLELSVLAQFFFYAAETLVPVALPLAILLASLISFGNMGERLELLAIKAAGITLFRTIRPLIIFNLIMAVGSFYFQDVVAPDAYHNLSQLLFSMRQKSPEVDIPEGVFYDGVEGMNLYVKQKNKDTGMLYNVIIYNMRDGVDNAHIILADSGKLETSQDKAHLLLHLYSGEQFENLRSNALMTDNVPYRRETFVQKQFIIDFDTNFQMADGDMFSSNATAKNMSQLAHDVDSIEAQCDSMGHAFYGDMQRGVLNVANTEMESQTFIADYSTGEVLHKDKKTLPTPTIKAEDINIDSIFESMNSNQRMNVVRVAKQNTQITAMDYDFKAVNMESNEEQIRRHWIQWWKKITVALSCLVFFFIGAPLGAIIRKGGLGLPIVISVIIYIVYYVIDTGGMKVGREGSIPVWFGMWLSTLVLAPLGVFFTIKSNSDSVVFNMDSYKMFLRKLLDIRPRRHISRKEVIINDPDYQLMAEELPVIAQLSREYLNTHRLLRFPHYVNLFFRNERDEAILEISERLEYCVDMLSNSKNKDVLIYLNYFPILAPYAHTAPFKNRRLNMVAGILFPIGIILVFRIARCRRRLRKDLKQIVSTADRLTAEIRSKH